MGPPSAPKAVAKRSPRAAASLSGPTLVLGVVALLAVLGITAVFVVLPVVVKRRCVAEADARGITLGIDHVAIGLGDVRLVKVDFSLHGVPQLLARADDAQVTLSGISPADAAVHGLSVTLEGPADEVQKAIDAWRTAQAARISATDAAKPRHITFSRAHVTWVRPFGQTATLESPAADGDAEASAGSLHLTAEQLTLTAGKATFGPYRTTLERGPDGTRTDIELDPAVRGGPSVVYVRTPAGAVSIRASIARSPLSRLGVPAKAIGLGADPDVEAQIGFDETLAGAADLTANVILSKAVFSGVPVDAQLVLDAKGDVAQGLDVKKGSLKAGPMVANVTGTVKLFDDGARLALAWTARPIPCTELGKQLAAQALGQLGVQLGALATDLGGAVGLRVAGQAAASGLITLDSRDVNAASFTMTSNETCGLALF